MDVMKDNQKQLIFALETRRIAAQSFRNSGVLVTFIHTH